MRALVRCPKEDDARNRLPDISKIIVKIGFNDGLPSASEKINGVTRLATSPPKL